MKKLTSIVCLLFGLFVFAQNSQDSIQMVSPNKPWTFGAKAGVNLSTLAGSYTDVDWVKDIDGIVAGQLGVWANYPIQPKLSLQLELVGSIQGADINYEQIPNPITGELLNPTGKMRLPYITAPVMLQYEFADDFYVEGGAQFNYLPKVNVKAFLNGEEVEDEQAADILTNRLKNARSLDVGLNIGAGYNFYDKWTVFTRYNYGLITVDKREDQQRDLKNRVFTFGLSYQMF